MLHNTHNFPAETAALQQTKTSFLAYERALFEKNTSRELSGITHLQVHMWL